MSAGGVRRRPLRPMGKLLAEDTKRHHRSLILQHLFAEGPASRADLARATGLTRVTVSDLVGGLIADGLLGELGAPVETTSASRRRWSACSPTPPTSWRSTFRPTTG